MRRTIPPPDPADPVQSLYSETDPGADSDPPVERPAEIADEEDVAMRDGQNWLEALSTDVVERGTEPEREVEIE